MSIVTKKSYRRTMLCGLGTPWPSPLDGMVPAPPAASAPRRRPNAPGFLCPQRHSDAHWLPKTYGQTALSPIISLLEPPRQPVRAEPLSNDVALGDGAAVARSWPVADRLPIKKTEGADIHAGVSMDQVAAKHLGTRRSCRPRVVARQRQTLGACDAEGSCATRILSWRDRTPVAPRTTPARSSSASLGPPRPDARPHGASRTGEEHSRPGAREHHGAQEALGSQDQLQDQHFEAFASPGAFRLRRPGSGAPGR